MRLITTATIALACSWTAAAQGQTLGQTGPAAERTGPQAQTVTPDFQEPAEFPDLTPPDAPPIPRLSGTASIADIAVAVDGEVAGVARADFNGLADAASGLTVSAAPGTPLDAAWVEEQFRANGMIGANVELDRLAAMIQLINRAFVANGYINSGLLVEGPPPTTPGTLQTRLVQGRLVGENDGIVLAWGEEGNRGLSEAFVTARMPSARNVPLDVIAIERDFRLLAENPAIGSVSADLQPGEVAGEARLAMIVRPAEQFDFYMGYANNRSPSIGAERFALGGSIRNMMLGGDQFSFEAGLTSGEPDANFGYSLPVTARTALYARGGFNEAAVIDPELLPLDISASDWNVEGGFTHRLFARPLTPNRSGVGWQSARSLTLGASVAHRVSKTRLLGRPFSFSPGAVDGRAEYTAARLTADFVERGIETVFVVSLTATQGLDGSRGDIPGLITPDRDFRSIRGQVSYARLLTDSGTELRMRLSGQYADGILYSGERFAAGGSQAVRGYRETLVLSDSGVIGSVELAQPFSLSGRAGATRDFDWGAFTISAFIDAAMLDNREIADPVSDELLSIGAGLEWRPSPAVQASISYAHALEDAVVPGQRDMQDRGFHFAITVRPLEFFR
ncbi:ShlB/FhaC/HecB family hemolysin secretion/activation protein [Aurantiacibacter gilvus]|uniref:ShlB/FhaC/HecB family hemolysin secretion/activation protein n=1 Tax=Aurantiacibacter gilvus TaxID=3139141 RepID=A0ABU9IFF8_9SPHN